MAPEQVSDNLLVWGAKDIDPNTIEQAEKMQHLPFVLGHVALMPDAHYGFGSTVGSVFATKGAIIPSAIGVDIGCGMAALKLDMTAASLPDDLSDLMPLIDKAVPGGMGRERAWGDTVNVENALGWTERHEQDSGLKKRAIGQCGTLGGGNHFFEVCLDENDGVWLVLHSGSRGVGNLLANIHIGRAKGLMEQYFIDLPDPALAYLVEGTPEFKAYIEDMLWAQDYAQLNRKTMLLAAMDAFRQFMQGHGRDDVRPIMRINCHHNFTEREEVKHGSKTRTAWVTRKGAIRARVKDMGIIPGSMGASTYIVKGRGNPASYSSCSHGAGRKLSRTKAKNVANADRFKEQMKGRVWNEDKIEQLLDENPDAYKDIDAVMAAQSDLVSVEHKLHQIFNYKGVN
jgi:tRNA-splicing ligase RtcB